MYKNKNGKGLFYGPIMGVKKITINNEKENEKIYKFGYDIGYRWIWESGLTLAPFIGLIYSRTGTIKNTSENFDIGRCDGDVCIQSGLGVGWAF